jgi:two-component system, NtrC family, sensor kinase
MHTLKVQLGLTLSVLLFISMFLFGFVMLMLWQSNGIQQEAQLSEKLLHIAAASIVPEELSTDRPALTEEIRSYFKESGILCLQWQNGTSSTIHSHGSCPTGLSLAPLLNDASVSAKTKTSYSGMSWNGFFLSKQYLLIATPLQLNQGNQGAIALVRSLDDVSSAIRKAQKIFFAYLVINVLIFTTIGFTRLIHLVIKPIERLSRLADSRTDLDDSSFLSSEGLGEFTQLSLSLNRLVTRIDGDKQELRLTVESLKKANDELQKNRDEMIRAEKLASIGRLSAGLAHEIGNPLGIIQGYIDLLTENTLSDEDREAFSKRATQELNRINSLIRNLLDLSRSPVASSVDTIDLHPLLRDLIETVRVRKTAITIHYRTDFQAVISEVLVDSDGLRQVFLNCILNSIDAIEETAGNEHGIITLSTENRVSENNAKCIQITLNDNGVGINPEHRDAIFDPFFTTKEVGKGTGLGLAVAHNLIKKSGGMISVSSHKARGTSVIIILPLSTRKNVRLQQGPTV